MITSNLVLIFTTEFLFVANEEEHPVPFKDFLQGQNQGFLQGQHHGCLQGQHQDSRQLRPFQGEHQGFVLGQLQGRARFNGCHILVSGEEIN